jgi:hypothetical protein
MHAEFIKYRDFFESETAAEFALVLRDHGIEYRVEEFNDSLGAPYGERPLSFVTTIMIRKADFSKVDDVVAEEAKAVAQEIDRSHYLYTFSNEELFEVISKPDEWNAVDYQLAKTILRQRGVMVDDVTFDNLKARRLEDLSRPEPDQTNWVKAGYIMALAGGIVGLFIGWHLMTYKKVLPNGDKVYGYRKHDRSHGRWIFIVGLIMFPIALLIRFSMIG